MNIKYKELSIIGKIWSVAELLQAGIRDKKDAYIISAFKKITILQNNQEILISNAIDNDTMNNIMEHATDVLHKSKFKDKFIEFNNDGSVVSRVWFCKIELDRLKEIIKNNTLLSNDILALNSIYSEIKGLWIADLKIRQLSSKERRDLFKIKEEIEDLKIRIEKRTERNQITII